MQTFVEQECIPVGCVASAAVAVCWGGVSAWQGGCLPARGRGACLVCPGRGRYLPSLSRGCLADTPPLWTEFLIHTCENINFPQLRLRTVILWLVLTFIWNRIFCSQQYIWQKKNRSNYYLHLAWHQRKKNKSAEIDLDTMISKYDCQIAEHLIPPLYLLALLADLS